MADKKIAKINALLDFAAANPNDPDVMEFVRQRVGMKLPPDALAAEAARAAQVSQLYKAQADGQKLADEGRKNIAAGFAMDSLAAIPEGLDKSKRDALVEGVNARAERDAYNYAGMPEYAVAQRMAGDTRTAAARLKEYEMAQAKGYDNPTLNPLTWFSDNKPRALEDGKTAAQIYTETALYADRLGLTPKQLERAMKEHGGRSTDNPIRTQQAALGRNYATTQAGYTDGEAKALLTNEDITSDIYNRTRAHDKESRQVYGNTFANTERLVTGIDAIAEQMQMSRRELIDLMVSTPKVRQTVMDAILPANR